MEAIRRASEKKNYVVVTGTGSGKTECFLIPIINDIMEEFQKTGPQKGVRAMILYYERLGQRSDEALANHAGGDGYYLRALYGRYRGARCRG